MTNLLHFVSKSLIAASLFFLTSHPASSESYCIQNLVDSNTPETDLSVEQSEITLQNKALTALALWDFVDHDSFTLSKFSLDLPPDKKGRDQLIKQSISELEDFREIILGPYNLDWSIKRGSKVINRKNNTISFVGGRYTAYESEADSNSCEKIWETELFTYDFKSPPKPLDREITEKIGSPRSVFWSDILDAYIISSTKKTSSNTSIGHTYLLKDSNVQPLKIGQPYFLKDLPELNLVIVLNRRSIQFLDSSANPILSRTISSGGDFEGWEDVFRLENNWIYISGHRDDYILKLEKTDADWSINEIYRIMDGGKLDNYLIRLFGYKDKLLGKWQLTDIYHTGTCRVYSPANKEMIFCDDKIIWENGRLSKIKDKVSLDWYVGDIIRENKSLFWGSNTLYSYDGVKWSIVADNIARGGLEKTMFNGRIFYGTYSAEKYKAYELKSKYFDFSATPVAIKDGSSFTRFLDLPESSEVFVFTRKAVTTVDGDQIFKIIESEKLIHTTGHKPPTYIPALNGIVFSIGTPASHEALMLLKKCNQQLPLTIKKNTKSNPFV